MTERDGKITLRVRDKRIYFEADLWLLWFALASILTLIGKTEIISLLERILAMLK